ncbi:unnamed protein product (mitochondrion) [Plasmodiophora brassicae]|uniref:CAP-Gly domain-containing protein n=1 Tax=Plasmodiophora brassicae TaxID=37360 RepID=A0A0G4ITM3_PLABS|nr:hypothetical protein PBRA_006585 [Plasmodiophora brassicae]SPQ95896.1 unnamed protein product [Plasmodiophora brassicae]
MLGVGCRVRHTNDADAKGTVRYIGPVEGRQGQWIGVEWDDRARGRHDGCVDGRRYFTCGRSAATFVRPSRLSPGITFVDALRRKYASGPAAKGAPAPEPGSGLEVEFVGEADVLAKQSQLHQLACVSVRASNVARVDDDIGQQCPSLIEVDLEDTLLDDWEHIARVTRQVPGIRELRLSKNALPSTIPPMGDAFARLEVLMLNAVDSAWTLILSLTGANCLPNLRELFLCDNAIDDAALASGGPLHHLPRLRKLDLSSNLISDWNQLHCLTDLPSLTDLCLDRNRLAQIPVDSRVTFPNLDTLSIFRNGFASIESFAGLLTATPALVSLRTNGNPFEDVVGIRVARSQFIGLLPRLTTLNRSEIGYRERQDAEIAFVQQAVLPGSTRHSALSTKYDIAPKPKPMPAATKTLQLTFRCVPPTSNTASNAATKNILPSMTVHLIAQLCRRLFGLKPSDPIDLYYQSAASSSSSSGPDRVLLDDPRQAIATYGICGPGDIIAHLHPGHCPK